MVVAITICYGSNRRCKGGGSGGGRGGSGAVEEGHGRKRSLSIVFCNFN